MALFAVRFLPLKTSLSNLPPSLYSPLVASQKRPQSLAVHVRTQAGRESYVGWSGLSSSRPAPSSGQKEYLEVDPGVGRAMGWQEGELVELSIIPSLPLAKEISVSPCSAEDWEVISSHADWLEQNLLFLIRVCSRDQRIEVWVKGKIKVEMVVERVDPDKRVVLLGNDTEVHVAPLTRPVAPLPSTSTSSTAPADTTIDQSRSPPPPVPSAHSLPLVQPTGESSKSASGQQADVAESYRGFRRGRELEAKLQEAQRSMNASTSGSVEELPPAVKPYLPGLEPVVQQSFDFLMNSLVLQSGMFFPPTLSHPRTMLLTGRARSGKTTLVKEVCRRLESDTRTLTYTRHLDVAKLADERLQGIKESLLECIKDVNENRPSVLVLDGVENLAGVDLPNTDSIRTTQIAELLVSFLHPDGTTFHPGTVVICTAKASSDIHPLLSGKHVFGCIIGLKGLEKEGRREVLESLVQAKLASSEQLQLDTNDSLNHLRVATETEGFLVSDIKDLVDRAVGKAAIRCSDPRGEGDISLAAEDFEAALQDFVPLSLKDVKLQSSTVKWSDIGGLQDVRRTLRETLEWPVKYAAIFKQSPLRLRSGLLLYGYPGCGKTLLASAVAKECGLNFISVKGPEILNKYIGASEKSVRDLFDRASAAKPCVLFFDEFDSIAPKRGHDSTGVTDRVVNQMLTQMDGAEGLDGVYVLAATSRPDLIDPALLRPGRLDKSLLCPMPSAQDRLEILQLITRNLHLSPLVSLSDLAAETQHFTGADLGGLVGTAHLAAVHATFESATEERSSTAGFQRTTSDPLSEEVLVIGGGNGGRMRSRAEEAELRKRVGRMTGSSQGKFAGLARESAQDRRETSATIIHPAHILTALASARPSVPEKERERLRHIYSSFVDERSTNGLEGAEGGGTAVGSRSSLG